ncbi:MAG: RNA methyltransferase [Clostridiales bacterium]|nr:RNA methyltransferase [Clostridiales bacterium]
MDMITSIHNESIVETRKLKQKKHREASGLFLAEGLRLCEVAAAVDAVEQAYYHEALADTDRGAALLRELSGRTRRFVKVSARVMQAMAETEAPQGILCVCKCRQVSLKDFQPDKEGLVLLADGIQDPGNLGAMLRILWAGEGRGLICLRGTTDPFGGKCVRASMGGIFHVPVINGVDWPGVARWAIVNGYEVIAAESGAGRDYRRINWPKKTLLCIGNEAQGLITIPAAEVKERVYIPVKEGAESLNAAVAAGILVFEANR